MNTTIIQPHKSSVGMDANITVLIIYISMAVVSWIPFVGYAAWVVPMVFFFLEKDSKFVKYQAIQALIIGIVRVLISTVFAIIIWAITPRGLAGLMSMAFGGGLGAWVVLGAISTLIGLAIMGLIIFLVIMAYGYKQVELPLLGPIATKASEQLDGVKTNFQQNSGPENKPDSENQNSN